MRRPTLGGRFSNGLGSATRPTPTPRRATSGRRLFSRRFCRAMDDLTGQRFLPHVGSEFRVEGPASGDDVSLRLAAVRDLGRQPNAPRVKPFALEFARPPEPRLE